MLGSFRGTDPQDVARHLSLRFEGFPLAQSPADVQEAGTSKSLAIIELYSHVGRPHAPTGVQWNYGNHF